MKRVDRSTSGRLPASRPYPVRSAPPSSLPASLASAQTPDGLLAAVTEEARLDPAVDARAPDEAFGTAAAVVGDYALVGSERERVYAFVRVRVGAAVVVRPLTVVR